MAKEIIIPDKINLEAWAEWIEYRKAKRKPVSPLAAKKQFKLLTEYDQDSQQEIIDNSIQNDYQGLFKLRGQGNERHQPGSPQGQTKHQAASERCESDLDKLRGFAEQSHCQSGGVLESHAQGLRPALEYAEWTDVN